MTALESPARVRQTVTRRAGRPLDWLEGAAVLAVLVVFAWGSWHLISVQAVLGNDESWYALMGEVFLGRAADVDLPPQRPTLLGALSAPIQLVSQSERALRSISLVFGIVLLLTAWWLGRRAGRVAGLVVITGMAAVPTLYRGATSLLTDLPAAALLLLGVAGLWYAFEERSSPGLAVAASAGCLAGAFYLRYGSVFVIALIVLSAVLVWGRRLRVHARAVIGGVLTFGALLLPHAIIATVELGAPWSRLVSASDALGRYLERTGRDPGLATYVEMFPADWPGLLPGVLLVAALVGVPLAFLARDRGSDQFARLRRLLVLMVTPAVLHFLIVGLTAHAERRFLYPVVALGVTAGGAAAGYAWTRLISWREGWSWTAATITASLLLVVGIGAALGGYWDEVDERQRLGRLELPVKVAGQELAQLEDPSDCLIVTSYLPQVRWYSGCTTQRLPPDPDDVHDLTASSDALLILFTGGKHQPQEEDGELDAYLERIDAGDPLMIIDGRTTSRLEPVTIYHLPRHSGQ